MLVCLPIVGWGGSRTRGRRLSHGITVVVLAVLVHGLVMGGAEGYVLDLRGHHLEDLVVIRVAAHTER